MPRVADEIEIIRNAILAFQRTTGIVAEIAPEMEYLKNQPEERPTRPHAAVRLRRGGQEWTFDIEVKPWLNAATVGLAVQKYGANRKWILVTRYAQPAIAEQMRNMKIQYMDAEGNAFLDTKDLLVFVKGQKTARKQETGTLGRPFKPAGMQVIFALICNPGLERKTYREIAAVTKTALGTIDWTMQELRQIGHLLKIRKEGRRIVNREALFEKWVAAYPQQLRPNQLVARYTPKNPDWWQTAELKEFDALWGGETAAALETGYLKPEMTTVYVGKDPTQLILRFKLNKDPRGTVEMYRRFWQFRPEEQREDTVPLPLIYADLLATGIDRNLETAKELRERKLDRYLK